MSNEPDIAGEGRPLSAGVSCRTGVATYCRQSATPVSAEAGVAGSAAGADGSVGCYGELAAELEPAERRELDSEGRCMVTLHRTRCQVRTDTCLSPLFRSTELLKTRRYLVVRLQVSLQANSVRNIVL